ncbi:Oligopeptide transport system permease protein [Magnetospirillum gryphiswaldense MSR-1 v2]|uniref:Oligopeptide transport system permease protein n=1 Tax=Magnetospirillum gryphiswaldense (strain DSM 6361 / JCM 21280 / NBRC 15271 / MSR-1) TaxID=431944 RepID=V6EWT4_MAGGM|nr:ABC transporter permease [Magnetospirillum gryphiswaldense]CDK97557.1 Oligopeptide transport system permease protein [Magnetospirillum gryphiswaldense MSR-1 v2]
MKRDLPALIGTIVLALLLAATVAAPFVAADPEAMNLATIHAPPSLFHPLGTDELGRDVASRLLHGGRVSLAVALATAVLAAFLGTAIGLLAGYHGGRLDALLMRLTDGVMALPLLPLLIVLAALDPTKLGIAPEAQSTEAFTIGRMVVIIALVGWTGAARLVRAQTMTVKARDYVRAATALGATPTRIMLRHILPNVASPMVVAATLSVGNIILVESALSFLGLGVQPPMASWGNMLTGAMNVIWSAPLQALWPGLAIFVTVLAFNLAGDGLQRRLDPRKA